MGLNSSWVTTKDPFETNATGHSGTPLQSESAEENLKEKLTTDLYRTLEDNYELLEKFGIKFLNI